jgi:hypothetical protein
MDKERWQIGLWGCLSVLFILSLQSSVRWRCASVGSLLGIAAWISVPTLLLLSTRHLEKRSGRVAQYIVCSVLLTLPLPWAYLFFHAEFSCSRRELWFTTEEWAPVSEENLGLYRRMHYRVVCQDWNDTHEGSFTALEVPYVPLRIVTDDTECRRDRDTEQPAGASSN